MTNNIKLAEVSFLISSGKWNVNKNEIDEILFFEKVELMNLGEKDYNEYQGFTPNFIVTDTIDAIGRKNIYGT